VVSVQRLIVLFKDPAMTDQRWTVLGERTEIVVKGCSAELTVRVYSDDLLDPEVGVTLPAGTTALFLPGREGTHPGQFINEFGIRFEEAMALGEPWGFPSMTLYRLPDGTELVEESGWLRERSHLDCLREHAESEAEYQEDLRSYQDRILELRLSDADDEWDDHSEWDDSKLDESEG
jgi:hypothetical protein